MLTRPCFTRYRTTDHKPIGNCSGSIQGAENRKPRHCAHCDYHNRVNHHGFGRGVTQFSANRIGHHLHVYVDFVIATTCPANHMDQHHLGDTGNGLQHQFLYCHNPSKPIFSHIPVSFLVVNFPVLNFIDKLLRFSELLHLNHEYLDPVQYVY